MKDNITEADFKADNNLFFFEVFWLIVQSFHSPSESSVAFSPHWIFLNLPLQWDSLG